MNIFFIIPSQTQSGAFPVFIWITGGDATSSITISDFTVTDNNGASVTAHLINKEVVGGQTRAVLSIIPSAGKKGTITVNVARNAFSIAGMGSNAFPTESGGKTSNPISFDTTTSRTVERPVSVKFFYVPSTSTGTLSSTDRTQIDTIVKQGQRFFADQMELHGYGRQTFGTTNDSGPIDIDQVSHSVISDRPERTAQKVSNLVLTDTTNQFEGQHNVFFVDQESAALHGETRYLQTRKYNYSIIFTQDNDWSWRTTAHELGHCFGLVHGDAWPSSVQEGVTPLSLSLMIEGERAKTPEEVRSLLGLTYLPSVYIGDRSARKLNNNKALKESAIIQGTGDDNITWTVDRNQFFSNGSKFTFVITFSEMILGDTTNLSATSFSFTGATTSNVTVTNVNSSYTQYRISGDVTRTNAEQTLNLNISRRKARRFAWSGGSPSHSGRQWPDSDLLLASVDIPAMESTPDPRDQEPRRPTPPPVQVAKELDATFSEFTTYHQSGRLSILVHFREKVSLQPINVAESEISAANFEIRDSNGVINGATIPTIDGQDNWRKLFIQFPAGTSGFASVRLLKDTVYWSGGIGPSEHIDTSHSLNYSSPSTPVAPPQEPETPVVENPVGPDETQLIAAAPMKPGGGGGGNFDGPDLIIITPEAGQAIRISELVNFNTNLTNVGRLVYHNNQFYTYDGGSRALYHVTKEDGTAERIGTALNFGVGESAPRTLFSYGGSLYLIGQTLRKVIRLDTTTGSGRIVGATAINIVNPLGAAVYQNQILIAAANGGGLFQLDSSTWKTVRLVGNEPYGTWNQMERNMVDMTVHRGRLYGIGDTHNRLYEINPLTGSAIQVNPYMIQFGARLTSMTGLASDGKDLYGTEKHQNALFNIRTRGSNPGETSDIIFKFDKPVYDFTKADIVTQWTADGSVRDNDIPDDGDIGDLDPSTGERGTTFQLPVRHRPGFSGILDIAVRAGSALQAAEIGTSAEGAPESSSSQAPNQYGPPVPVTARVSYKLTSTTVVLSVPPTTVFSENSFVQTATWSEDVQEFEQSDIIIRTEGVTITNFQRNSGNNKIYTWTLNFNDSVNDIVEIGINAGSVFDSIGREAPIEDRFVSFYVDLTADEASTDVPGVTVLCEETFTIRSNPFLQDLLPEDQRNIVTNQQTGAVSENVYGGLFKGVLEYLKMDDLDRSYAVVQIAKPNIFGDGADEKLPAAAVLVEITSSGCEVIETYEYSLLAPRSLTQDGDHLYYFIGSHYAYEYLPQWTNPEPPNDQFAPQFFPRSRDVKTYNGDYFTTRTPLEARLTHRARYVEQHAKVAAEHRTLDHRAVVPDFYQRQADQKTISSLLSDRGVLVKYNARTKQEESRQTVWKSKDEDPVTMKTGRESIQVIDSVEVPVREFTGTAKRQTPGYGVYGGMASPMVIANGKLNMVAGFGDQRFIKSTRYKNSQRQDAKVEPVTDIDNWNWISFSDEVEKRLPLLETNNRTYEQVLKDLAATLFCYIGYDANRNLIFRFKEPKQALLRNPVSNNLAVADDRRNIALELKQPNIKIQPEPEKIVDVSFDISGGKIFAGFSGVYHIQSPTLRRIDLESGDAAQTWDISGFTLSGTTGTFREVRRHNMFFYGTHILAHIRLTNGNEALYRVDLDNGTLTLIGSNDNAVRSESTHFRSFTEHNGLIYGIASNIRSLFRFDATSGTATRIAQIDPRTWNPFNLESLEGKLWVSGLIDGQIYLHENLWIIDPATARYGDGIPAQNTPILFTWRWIANYLGTTLMLYSNTLYKIKLTGLVKVEDELIEYGGVAGTENEPVLINIERGQRDTMVPNNHNVSPVYFIDYVISMTDHPNIKPINKMNLRLDASQTYNVFQIHYADGEKTYTIDNTTENEIKRTFDLTVPLDKNQFHMVKWLAERYEAWYKDPQIIADTSLQSSFYLNLGDIVLIEEPESILDNQNLFQTVEISHSVKELQTKAKFRQIATIGDRVEFGHVDDTQIVQNQRFDQTISSVSQSAAIVAFPRDPVPQGIQVNPDTGQVFGIARQISDSGQTFRVAYSQILNDQVETQEITYTVLPSRPPVWDIDDQYFFNTVAISVDLSTYVTGKAPITFEAIGTLPSFLTLTGTMLTGTNPRTSQMTARILAKNADGSTEKHFIFARATDPLPVYGQGVYGTSKYPFSRRLPTVFSSDPPSWATDADYFSNDASTNIDLSIGYINNPTIPTFAIIGAKPEWLTLNGSSLTGTNPRTNLISVKVRATNENGSSDKTFYFGRAADHAPQYGSGITYGTGYYV